MTRFPSALLFEDHDSIRKMVGTLLANAGYAVESHVSPDHYFQKPDLGSRLGGISLLWTDNGMPGMCGIDAAINSRENGFDGLVVMHSADPVDTFLRYQHPDFTAGNWRGPVFDIILPKPLGLNELEGAIADFTAFNPRLRLTSVPYADLAPATKDTHDASKPKGIYTTGK